jgi:hypothetical protein
MSEQQDSPHFDRRDLLKGMAAAGLTSALEPLAGALAKPPASRDLIRAENEKPGTTEWMLTLGVRC